MPDSESTDPKRPAPEEGSSPPVRVAATDLAILVAFCRSYIAGQRFPSPAPNNKILEELGENGLYMDRDALRGHLRNLYAKFGVEEGLTPAEKRVRLVERVYESNVIPGWGDEPSETPASLGETPTEPVHAKRQTLTRLTAGWRETGSTKLRLPGYVRDRPLAIAGLAAVLIGLSAFAIVGMSTGDTDPSPKTGRSVGKVIDPRLMSNTQGTITYCTGEDVVANRDGTTHQHEKAVKDFNDEFGPALHVNLHQFPDDATQQYERFRALQLKRSGFCDVFYSDVTWTADFAHNGWLIDLTPYVRPRLQSFVRAMREAADFNGKIWGVPKQTDAGLLFFNTDRVKDPPRTWQELYQQAAHGPRKKRLRYQGLSYEGLTVAFLEVAYAVGAEEIVMPNRKANINQPKALRALQFMAGGIRSKAVPREIVYQKEKDSLSAFGEGRADFMRNWPYVHAALNKTEYPKVAGKVGVTPLPRWEDRAPVSVLGGHILVISAFSENPGAALKLVDYLSSADVVKQDAIDFSLAPALVDLWQDRDVQHALPAFSDLKSAVEDAKLRPETPNYPAISEAIHKNVNRALNGLAPEDALEAANDEMQQALDDAYREVAP